MESEPLGTAGVPAGTAPDSGRPIPPETGDIPHTWHSRGYLPHIDQPGLVQAITFRLFDSVPGDVLEKWKEELKIEKMQSVGGDANVGRGAGEDASGPRGRPGLAESELRRRIAKYEDAGHGACWLRGPRIAALVENAMLHFDNARYRLIAWCIMPNHVHALIEPWDRWPLAGILHSWKSYTAKKANHDLARTGPFWSREYHDRYIRDEVHFKNAVEYVEQNPVKAGLVKVAEEWRWSSAGRKPGSAGVPASP